MMFHKQATLVLLCKRPALGHGKQRLAQSLEGKTSTTEKSGAEKALLIAEHLLECALEDLMDWQGEIVIAPAHQEDDEWAAQLLRKTVQVCSQGQGNLGERLNYLDQQLRQQGHQKLIFIGSDAPTLSAFHYQQISEALENKDIALCPAQDGGVTIMANKCPWPQMQHLPWSTEHLDHSLTQLCLQHQLSVLHTSPCYDIDTQTQLAQLMLDLQKEARPARQALLQCIRLL